MDFETALQKLNDVLIKEYRYISRIENGLWKTDPPIESSVVATLENDELVVEFRIDVDDGDILVPPNPFRKPLAELKTNDFYLILRHFADWLVFTPLADKTHPCHIEPDKCHKFIVKLTA